MTKPKAPAKKPAKAKAIPGEYEIELEPGAWERFEKLVKAAAKMGPKPHAEKKQSSE